MRTEDADRPVVVEMAQLVGQSLHVVWLQCSSVMNHVVVGRSNGALADRLRDQEEVIPIKHIRINFMIINVNILQRVGATVP